MQSYDAPAAPENPQDADPDDGSLAWLFRQLDPQVREMAATWTAFKIRGAFVLGAIVGGVLVLVLLAVELAVTR